MSQPTTDADGLALLAGTLRGSNPGAKSLIDNVVKFYVRVISEPLNVASSYADMLLSDNFIEPPFEISGGRIYPQDPEERVDRPRLIFMGKILRASNGLRPHVFLDDPCQLATAGENDVQYLDKIISLHTLFISQTGMYGITPKFGDIVTVGLGQSDFRGPELKVATFSEVSSTQDAELYSSDRSANCVSLKSRLFLGTRDTGAGAGISGAAGFGNEVHNAADYVYTDPLFELPTQGDRSDVSDNIKLIKKQMDNFEITDKYARIAILSVIAKESGVVPQVEKCYTTTSFERIQKTWPYFERWDEQSLTELRANCVAFFNYTYEVNRTAKYGNRPGTNDGYNYRGRGFNQITFRGTYKNYAKYLEDEYKGSETETDILANPDLLNKADIAAFCAVKFLSRQLTSSKYGFPPTFAAQDAANVAMANANAGWKKCGTMYDTSCDSVKNAIALTKAKNSQFTS